MAYIETIATHYAQDLSEQDITDIGGLISRLSNSTRVLDRDSLAHTLEHSLLVALRLVDGTHTEIVSMGVLTPLRSLSRFRMNIDDVCTAKGHVRKGYARIVMETLLAHARKFCPDSIDLTTSRKEAVPLYLQMGFVQRNTNSFRLELSTEPPT